MARESLSGYGLDFERRITKKALKETFNQDPPRTGYESVVSNVGRGIHILFVKNIGGKLVLASFTTPKVNWKHVFGV